MDRNAVAWPPLRDAALEPMGFAPSAAGSWLVFEVDAQACAIDSRQLRQIALAGSIVRLPGPRHPAWPGIVAWQQRALSVLDCGAAMGRHPSLGGAASRVLVVQDEARLGALLVDAVRGLHQESPARLIDVQRGLPPPWNAVRALLPLADAVGGEVCPILHVPTLWNGCLRPAGLHGAGLAESRA
jgi:hypothetical protein